MVVERLVVQCYSRYLELTTTDAHFCVAGAGVRVLLHVLLVHLTFEAACLCRAQSAQVERVRQVELGQWVHLSFHPAAYLVQIRIVTAADVPSHG